MNRKQKQYLEVVLPALKEEFGYANDLEAPKLLKVVINRGIRADDTKSANLVEEMVKEIAMIAGQKPVIRLATKSISNFKLREGMPNGIMVTLRKERMFAFVDKFVSLASPRIRDFRGFKLKGDKRGNFTIGITDQRIFIEGDNFPGRGFNVTFVTTAKTDKEGLFLLKKMGFPLR